MTSLLQSPDLRSPLVECPTRSQQVVFFAIARIIEFVSEQKEQHYLTTYFKKEYPFLVNFARWAKSGTSNDSRVCEAKTLKTEM